jgi:hypothetical protein
MRMLRWSNMSRSGFLRSINVERMTTAGPIRPNSKKQPAEKWLQIVGWIDTRRSCADLFPFHSLSIFRLFSLLYGWMQLPPFHFATTNQPGEYRSGFAIISWPGSGRTTPKRSPSWLVALHALGGNDYSLRRRCGRNNGGNRRPIKRRAHCPRALSVHENDRFIPHLSRLLAVAF